MGTRFYDEVSMRKGILWSCKIINKKNVGQGTGKPSEEITNKMFVSILTLNSPNVLFHNLQDGKVLPLEGAKVIITPFSSFFFFSSNYVSVDLALTPGISEGF